MSSLVLNCGLGEWYQQASLNMSDLHSSVHLPGGSTTLMVSGLAEDHVLQVVVGQALSMLSDVSTAAIRLVIQMPLAIGQLHKLTLTMSMASVSLMEHLVATSEPMLLVCQKEAMQFKMIIVHVVIPVTQAVNFHHLLLRQLLL